MRVMVIVKATKNSEAGIMPSEKLLADMTPSTKQLVKAGIMQSGDGLKPSSAGKRVRFTGGGGPKTVIDGPFAETKELIAGFWLWTGEGHERSGGLGDAAARIPCPARNPKSKSVPSSRPRISAPSTRPNCARKEDKDARGDRASAEPLTSADRAWEAPSRRGQLMSVCVVAAAAGR